MAMKPRKLRRGLWFSEKTKTWHYEFKHEGQPYKGDTGHALEKDARNWKAKKIEALKNLEVGLDPPKAPAPTLAKALVEWCEAHQGVSSDRHVVNVTRAVELHAAALLDTPIDAITLRDLEKLRSAYLLGTGTGYHEARLTHTEGGANKALFHLRLVLTWCGKHDLGPREVPRLAPLAAQEGAQGIVWPEQVQAFLAEAWKGGQDHKAKVRQLPHSATAICLMLGLGLRENEALGARWEWLDTRRQVYVVGRAKSRRLREVPLPDWLARHLAQLRATQGHPARGLILPASLDEEGKQIPHGPGFTTKSVVRCAAALKIIDLTPHRLRATFATTHFETGTKITQIQQMLGHRDPATTLRYIVQRPKDQAEAQELVAAAMGFASGPPTVTEQKQKNNVTPTSKRKAQ